jgi:hypothetical protein
MSRRWNAANLFRRTGSRWTAGGVPPLTPPASAVLLLRESGITEVGSHVATWDSEGSNTLRWSAPTAPQRPQLDLVGALTGAKCLASGDYLRSEAAFTIVKPYVVYALFRVDTWVANRRILEFATGDYLAYRTSSGQKLVWEQGGVDLVSTSAIVDGDIISVVVSIQTTGGTNRLYVDGIQEATGSPNAAVPASTVVGIGARGTDGVNPSDTTFLEMGVWSFADNAASDAFDMAALLAYAAQQRTAAGGV